MRSDRMQNKSCEKKYDGSHRIGKTIYIIVIDRRRNTRIVKLCKYGISFVIVKFLRRYNISIVNINII